MKIGAERKKIIVLVSLVVVAGIVYWINSSGVPPAPVSTRPAADAVASGVNAAPVVDPGNRTVKKRVASGKSGSLSEFVPKPPDAVDASKVDPTLRLDLLAKVQAVNAEGGARNLFQFCMDCAQKEAAAKAAELAVKTPVPPVSKILVNGLEVKPGEPIKPPPAIPQPAVAQVPQINLKYYGYSTKFSDGEKKAFFLDGEDVIVAAEGEIIKKQYKVVRISNNSVQMEDTQSKSKQTLPMQQDAPV